MTLEWFYQNLFWIVIILSISAFILLLFPILLGRDLIKKENKKK